MKQILKTSYSILLLSISFSFLQASDKQIVQCVIEPPSEEHTSDLVNHHINDIKEFFIAAKKINHSYAPIFRNLKKITKNCVINFLDTVKQDSSVDLFGPYIQIQQKLISIGTFYKGTISLGEYANRHPYYGPKLLESQCAVMHSRNELFLHLLSNRDQAVYAKELMQAFYEQYFVRDTRGW